MSPSPVGTDSLTSSKNIDRYSKKFSMDFLVCTNPMNTSSIVDTSSYHSPLLSDTSEINATNSGYFNETDQINVMMMMSDSFMLSNLPTSPECSRSSSTCSSFSSLTLSSMNKKNLKNMNQSNDDSVNINKNISLSTTNTTSTTANISNTTSLASGPTLFNDHLNDSLTGPSISYSLDRLSNHSFMEYFNLSDSISVSPPDNQQITPNKNQNENIEFKQTLSSELSIKHIKHNSAISGLIVSANRTKKYSFSSTNCLFPYFDDGTLDDNFDHHDFDDLNDFDDETSINNIPNNTNNIVCLANSQDFENFKTSRISHHDFSDLNIDMDSEQSSHVDNNEALVAIREMAIRDRRSQQRKHKNSTSSISSNSMSSRIKKFAIDLQNTATNLSKEQNNNIKPVPIYSSSTATSTHNHNIKNFYKNEIFTTLDYGNCEHSSKLDSDIELERLNFNVDDEEFGDFFELEGWEQMLDEDCISRLTTDFSINTTEYESMNDAKSSFETNTKFEKYNSENNCIKSEQHSETKSITQALSIDTETTKTLVGNKEANVILKSTLTSPSFKMNSSPSKIVNDNQSSINSSISGIKFTTNQSSHSSTLRLPTTTVLSSSTTMPKLQNLSNLSSISSINKPQPLVVVLSSISSPTTSSNSTSSVKTQSSSSAKKDSSLNLNKTISQFRQVIIGNNNKTNSSISQALSITNNQIKKLNISSSVQESIKTKVKQEKNLLENTIKDGKIVVNDSEVLSATYKCLSSSEQVEHSAISRIQSQPQTDQKLFESSSAQISSLISISSNKNSKAESTKNCNSIESMTHTLIDASNEVIDCINPDQIFPYRLAKNELDNESSNHNTNEILEKNLKLKQKIQENENINADFTNEDDEDDEEIDVVSVNNNSSISLIESNTNLITNDKQNNKLPRANSKNLNHHNYFHQPSSNGLMTNKKPNTCLSAQNKASNQSSLLAKYLKSPNSIQSLPSTSIVVASPKSDSIQLTVESVASKFSSNSIQNNSSAIDKKCMSNAISCTSNTTKNSNNSTEPNASLLSASSNIQILNKHKTLSLKNQNHQTKITTGSLTKSISSPVLQHSSNAILNASTLNPNKKCSIASIQSGSNINKSSTISDSNSFAPISETQKIPNSIRILTTTANNSNSVIRQINQTTTIASNTPSQHKTASINNKINSSNIIQMSNQSSICKISKISNESKIINTTLITRPQNTSVLSNLNKSAQQNLENSLVDPNINKKIIKTNQESNDIDFKQKLLFNNFNNNKGIDTSICKSPKLPKSSRSKLNLTNKSITSVDDDYELEKIDGFLHDDFEDEIEEDDDDEDDDDDVSSESADEEPTDDICLSLLQNNSSLSPLSLTSSVNSSSSSGYSTPTKSKSNKIKKIGPNCSSPKGLSSFNEKLKAKKMRKNKLNSCSSMSSLGQSALSVKRNNRLSTLGYSNENPAEKRAFHILSERQRRNDLKKLFETLRTSIPNLCDKQKASKLTILKAAVDHLIEVSNKKERLGIIFDKEKQRNVQLMQNLKNLQQSFNSNSNNFNHFPHQSSSSPMTALIVH